MPQLIPGLVTAALGAAPAVSVLSTFGGSLLLGAGLVAFGQVQRRRQERARRAAIDQYNAGLSDRTVTLMGADAPWQVIYGTATVAPVQVAAMLPSGVRDEYKHVVLVWAAHPCDAIEDLTIAGEALGALDAAGQPTTGKWAGQPETSTSSHAGTLNAARQVTLPDTPSRVVSVGFSTGTGDSIDTVVVDMAHVSTAGAVLTIAAAGWNEPLWGPADGHAIAVTYEVTTTTPRVRVRHHLGAPGQLADADMLAELPGQWSASDRLQGLCYTAIRFDLREPEFQAGLPEVRARIRGKLVYDHRTNTTTHSQNVALCTADFLRAEYGKEALDAQMGWVRIDAAANACDEALASHGGAARYTCNGAFRTDSDPDQTLAALAQAMGGFVTFSAGLWEMQAGVYTAPVMALNDADNRGAVDTVEGPGEVEVFNSMRGRFYDPSRYDEQTDYPPYSNAAFVAEDGAALWADLTLPFTAEAWRCHNLARIQVERGRGQTVRYPAKMRAVRLKAGQRVTLQSGPLQMPTPVVYRVVKREHTIGQAVMLMLQRDDASFYDEADAPASLASPYVADVDPFRVAAPGSFALASNTTVAVVSADGTVVSAVRATWAASADTLVLSGGALQLEYREDSVPTWQRLPEVTPEATQVNLPPLRPGVLLVARARWRNSIGTPSDWVSATVVVADVSAITGGGGPGERGSVDASRLIAGTTWSNTEADSAISTAGYGTPKVLDRATLFNAAGTFGETRVHNGTTWVAWDSRFDGQKLLVDSVDTPAIREGAVTTVSQAQYSSSAQALPAAASNATFEPTVLSGLTTTGAPLTVTVNFQLIVAGVTNPMALVVNATLQLLLDGAAAPAGVSPALATSLVAFSGRAVDLDAGLPSWDMQGTLQARVVGLAAGTHTVGVRLFTQLLDPAGTPINFLAGSQNLSAYCVVLENKA
jgi:hypothetical protein